MWWIVRDVPGIDGILKVGSTNIHIESGIKSPVLSILADVYDAEAWTNEGRFSHKGAYLSIRISVNELLEWATENGDVRVIAGDVRALTDRSE